MQAKKLYDITKTFAGLKNENVVYYLYAGVGSIALYVSGSCKRVVGIEQIEDAIKDAKENAKLRWGKIGETFLMLHKVVRLFQPLRPSKNKGFTF